MKQLPFSSFSVWRRVVGARNRAFTLAVRSSFASWGEGSSIRLPIRVNGEQSISVGRHVVIGEGSWLQTLGDGVIDIGDRCKFSGYLVISAALSIVLERDVLVARNVHILDHIHRFDCSDLPIHGQSITTPRPVRLGEGSWIGANVVILPGVTVGRGSVIGANSVVDRDVRDRVVVVGAPAREVRQIEAADRLRTRS
ncbi:MAG: acyltransferase [Solirubrobacteraceae bacterium]